MSDTHADRRSPSAPDEPLDLREAGETLLKEARSMASGRASRSLTPGAHAPLKQNLVAVLADVELSEHQTNGSATIQLLQGRATIASGDGELELHGGQWATIPLARHNLVAGEDTVALITVAPTATAPHDEA